MAQIVINEVSSNYTYNIGASSYATVALPITAAWGPCYVDPSSVYSDSSTEALDLVLEDTQWKHFPANQQGLESFVATYRGPESNYRLANDYSYQTALTLLSSGYDVLVCRVCPGARATATFTVDSKSFVVDAKYPGTFGNNLVVKLAKVTNASYWSLITYVLDSTSGATTAVENLLFTFQPTDSDTIPCIDELGSAYLKFNADSSISDSASAPTGSNAVKQLAGGTDIFNQYNYGYILDTAAGNDGTLHQSGDDYYAELRQKPADWDTNCIAYFTGTFSSSTWTFTAVAASTEWTTSTKFYKKFTAPVGAQSWNPVVASLAATGGDLATIRYRSTTQTTDGSYYIGAGYTAAVASTLTYLTAWTTPVTSTSKVSALVHNEWVYNAAFLIYQLLQDKLNYNPNRIISPGWDDQNIYAVTGDKMFDATNKPVVSPLHRVIVDTAYRSRCAAGLVDIPRACTRALVYNESADTPGYAQMLSKMLHILAIYDDTSAGITIDIEANKLLYASHSALFAPWRQFKYVGTNKMCAAPPAFLALLIQRAQMLNQADQYEWALPINRKQNINIGRPDYVVPTKLLNIWQKLEGVGVNVIADIPDIGTTVWGNSTLFNVPPATYQALANLSTRYLVNAVEDVSYRCGMLITFQYNNNEAYSAFYAGVVPTLDIMRNQGAIDDYYIEMSADIDGLSQVNANSVIGKIYLVINGVINDITIDLIALPPGTDLNQFRS